MTDKDAAYLAATEEFLLEFAASADFIDNEDVDNSNSRCFTHAGRAPSEQHKTKAADRRTRYRKKLQDERNTLRRQERELTAKLSELQEAQARAKKEAKKADTLALSAWRATAARQKERRLEVEQQQERLQMAVLGRAQLIGQMNSMLLQPSTSGLSVGQSTSSGGGLALFKTFVRELDSLYERTDDMMASIKFTVSPPEEYAMTRKWNPAMTLLESANSTELPFSFERTWRALSELLLGDSSGSHHEAEVAVDPTTTAAIRYQLSYMLEGGDSATVVAYSVVRRYVEAERVVFVWRVLTEGEGKFDGLYANENAWLVLQPSVTKTPSTTVEDFARMQPVGVDGRPALSDARGHRFAKLLKQIDNEDISDIQRALLQLLLHGPEAAMELCL
jgi:hypothetical protein